MKRSRTWIEKIEPPLPEHIVVCGPGDVHLAADNRSKALLELLRSITTDVLVLSGDFLDTDNLEKLLTRLSKTDRKVIEQIHTMHDNGMRIVYLLGNHDADVHDLLKYVQLRLLDEEVDLRTKEGKVLKALDGIRDWEICTSIVLEHRGVQHFFIHGDQWDHIVHSKKIITGLGTFFWEILKRVDKKRHKYASAAKRNIKKWTQISKQVASGAIAVAKAEKAQYAYAGHTHDIWEFKLDGVKFKNLGSFDLHESGFFTIDREGVVRLHRIYTFDKHIKNPRKKK